MTEFTPTTTTSMGISSRKDINQLLEQLDVAKTILDAGGQAMDQLKHK